MKDTITKAIEGGWKPTDKYSIEYKPENVIAYFGGTNAFLLDPLFWQALGKAEGWRDKDSRKLVSWCYGGFHEPDEPYEEWIYHWHMFISHLAEGKTADSFFEELLTPNSEREGIDK